MTDQLLVDVGNTQAKWWLMSKGAMVAGARCDSAPSALLASLEAADISASVAALASVAAEADDTAFQRSIERATGAKALICRATAACLGLRNSYAEPGTMGVDRWLAMLAAWRPDSGPVGVVDLGTAMTVDLVAADGLHLGGFILPGPVLMQEALVARTWRIKVSSHTEGVLRAGTSTADCVAAGAWLATVGALKELTLRYPDFPLIATGGNAPAVLALGVEAQWRPDLVRDGLALWLGSQLASG